MSYDPLAPRAPGGNRVVKFFVAFIALAALAGGVGYLYGNKHDAGGAPPLVKADTSPTKVVPENPGGMQIPNQNMNVYNNMGGSQQAAKPGTEKLLPPPEQAAPQAARVAPAEAPSVAAATAPAQVITPRPEPAQVPTASATAPAKPPVPAPAPAPAATAAVVAPKSAAPPPAGATWRVQLGAQREMAAAENDWKRISAKYADVLGGLTPAYERADLGDKGVFLRLQAGPVTEARAREICDRLKAANQGCLVVRK